MNPKMCGAGAPARERLEARNPDRVKPGTILAAIVGSFRIIVAALREIFDESAYERFLLHRRLASSAEAYTEFSREHEQSRVRRPRCC